MSKTVQVRDTGKRYPNFSINIPTNIARELQLKNKQKLFVHYKSKITPYIFLSMKEEDKPSISREFQVMEEYAPKTGKIKIIKHRKIKSPEIVKRQAMINSMKESIKRREENMDQVLEAKIDHFIQEELDTIDNAKRYIRNEENRLKKLKQRSSS